MYLACAYQNGVNVERHVFDGDRQEIRRASVEAALKLVIQVIQQEYK